MTTIAGGPGGLDTFGRRLLLAVDAKGYGRADVLTQSCFQEAIPQLVGVAARAAGEDMAAWAVQQAGDSVMAVLPEGASEPAMVDTFMRRLDAGLRAFNHGRVRDSWLELRAALHFGTASPGANGFVGRAPVEIGRLLDSRVLRSALAAAEDAPLAVAVSATVFNDVVREAYTTVRARDFLQVRIEEKEYAGRAWIWVPGHDVHTLGLDAPAAPDAATGTRDADVPAAPARSDDLPRSAPGHRSDAAVPSGAAADDTSTAVRERVVQNFHGTVHASGAVFGISK
ncbi:hypothetical protein [Streptomyces uncialis]|uniref:hypothetical protein n=1 Tax=Streptomyces uncialis TaxID=1048205 RepID=UPI00386697AB|nr:hypothetical protein OG924_19745 [Streptomyces uncialis]